MVLSQKLQIFQETVLTISPAALTAIKRLQQEHNVPDYALRLVASSAGCSGLQYQMAFEAEAQDDDRVLSIEGLRILLDPSSLAYLNGVSIDYVQSLTGSGFQINPSKAPAASGCGCGSASQTAAQNSGTQASACCN